RETVSLSGWPYTTKITSQKHTTTMVIIGSGLDEAGCAPFGSDTLSLAMRPADRMKRQSERALNTFTQLILPDAMKPLTSSRRNRRSASQYTPMAIAN